MKKAKLLSIFVVLTFMLGITIQVSAHKEGCVFQKAFGSEKTTVYDGVVDQSIEPCQSGTLEFLSVYMQSEDVSTFGTHLNVYKLDNHSKELIHSQQVVVPSIEQNPYAKIWLSNSIEVDEQNEYSFEITIPEGKAITFFHPYADKNVSPLNSKGLSYEFGINSDESGMQNRGDDIETWNINIPNPWDCNVGQKNYNDSFTVPSGRTITQSFTACADGKIMEVYFNMDMENPSNLDRKVVLYDVDQDVELGYVFYDYSATGDAVVANFDGTILLEEGNNYEFIFAVDNQLTLDFQTIDNPGFFIGDCTFGGESIDMNMCFIVTIDEPPVISEDDDTEEDDTEEEEEHVTLQVQYADLDLQRESTDVKYSLYPNPFDEEVFIKFDKDIDSEVTISLYNFMGNMVYQVQTENIVSNNAIQLNPIQDLVKGYYTVRIEYENNVV